MCCLAEFIVKYVLIIANLVFALAGLAIIIIGSIVHSQLNQIHDVIPVNLSFLTISVIVIGCIIFVIAFCACCGAIRESQWMLITFWNDYKCRVRAKVSEINRGFRATGGGPSRVPVLTPLEERVAALLGRDVGPLTGVRQDPEIQIEYAVFMGILAAVKIYITVVIYKFLDNTYGTVSEWLTSAFSNENETVRAAYGAMETLFRCCGTYGVGSYHIVGREIPPTCCDNPNMEADTCTLSNSYDGCILKVGDYFENFGGAVGAVMITIIIVECVCLIFGLFMACSIRNKRYR